ncbi:MAG: NUDIX domain-containing protein [Armatimonadetes bacterium]|nr:NUDIX domain-containing protein [Armatimonadota bacterium]MBI2972371.1 NUDIX domain-containing protein [Armatimonadota bacterium]
MLLIKRRNAPHAGQWDGIGGRLEPDEDPFTACLREVREETGLAITAPRLRTLLVISVKSTDELWLIFVFSAQAPQGTLTPSDEGELAWVGIDQINTLPVVADLPMLLSYLDRDKVAVIRQEYETDDAASVTRTQTFTPPN